MKSFLKAVCFCLCLALALEGAGKALEFKYDDGIYSMKKFYKLKQNVLDVLVLGSSHAFVDINPGILWEGHGMASYVLGGSAQPFWNTYYYLKEALKTQKPKLIVLEAYAAVYDYDYADDTRIINNIYGMKWSKNKMDAVRASVPEDRWKEFFPGFVRYHARYNQLNRDDFLPCKGDVRYENWKGFYDVMVTASFNEPEVCQDGRRKPMSEKTETYYRKILDLIQEYKIPALVTVSPYAGVSRDEQAIFYTARDIAKEYEAGFVNYNLLFKETGIDYSCDAADAGHLNYRGNRKYTRALGKYIDSHFDVPDRRSDPAYKSWEDEAGYLSASAEEQELRETSDMSEIIKKLQNPDYMLVITADGSCTADDESFAGLFGSLGIPCTGESGFWVTDSTDGVLYASGDGNAELYLHPDSHDLHISRHYNESSQGYVNTVKLDNVCYKKTDNGVNILVYSTVTQVVTDAFGFNKDDICHAVR